MRGAEDALDEAPLTEPGPDESSVGQMEDEGSGSPPARPGRRRWGSLVVVGVIVAVVILLYLSGLLPGIHPASLPGRGGGGQAGPQAMAFQSAYPLANASAQSQPQGPWGLVAAFSIASVVGTRPHLSATSDPCSTSLSLFIPAVSTSSVAAGASLFWLFDFTDPGQDTLVVGVLNGSASALDLAPASDHCLGNYGTRPIAQLPDPTRLMDSSAVTTQFAAQLSGELANGSAGWAELILTDEGSEIGTQTGTAFWSLWTSGCDYSTLSFDGDPNFQGIVNASGGAVVLSSNVAGVGFCLSTGTVNSDLSLGTGVVTMVNATISNFTYPVAAATATLTASELHPILYSLAGGAVPGPAILRIVSLSGQVVAVYNFPVSMWTLGASATLVTTDSLVLEGPSTLVGQGLVLAGNAPLTGDINLVLP
ncbi:MAG TPA: hypothetical protein VGU43_00870 [Thermoplasmata archaeon]|nr:hypothetical protein [Thermoplasmata archaeon]